MSSDDECIYSPLKRKKGVSNSDKYKRNIIKQAKIEGKKHTNWIGKIVAAKNDPSLILKECCSKKCLKDIQQEKLEDIMKMFYELHSKNEQDLHLQRTIEIKEIARKRKRIETEEGKEKPKSKSVQYFLIVDGQRIQSISLGKTYTRRLSTSARLCRTERGSNTTTW